MLAIRELRSTEAPIGRRFDVGARVLLVAGVLGAAPFLFGGIANSSTPHWISAKSHLKGSWGSYSTDNQ
jgi:hypothetical protein